MNPDLPPDAATSRHQPKRRKVEGVKFSELSVGARFCLNVLNMTRVYRKCGHKAAIKPEGGTCRVAHNQIVIPVESP